MDVIVWPLVGPRPAARRRRRLIGGRRGRRGRRCRCRGARRRCGGGRHRCGGRGVGRHRGARRSRRLARRGRWRRRGLTLPGAGRRRGRLAHPGATFRRRITAGGGGRRRRGRGGRAARHDRRGRRVRRGGRCGARRAAGARLGVAAGAARRARPWPPARCWSSTRWSSSWSPLQRGCSSAPRSCWASRSASGPRSSPAPPCSRPASRLCRALLAVSAAIRSLIADSSSFMSNGLPAREPSGGGDGSRAVERHRHRAGRSPFAPLWPCRPFGRLGQVLQRLHRVLDAADRVSHLEVEDRAGRAADDAHLLGQHAVDDVLHDCARIEQLSDSTEI